MASDVAGVRRLAAGAGTIAELTARQSVCRACPRLVAWREEVAAVRRRSFAGERYWGRPVPGWGEDAPWLLIVGLAPAAHGGNRTGRIFTGDRSGDVLFAALHRAGLAAKPYSVAADDGQRLIGTRMVAAVRCAPPGNRPSVLERDTCRPWLAAELALIAADLRVIVCLGGFAWQAAWRELSAAGYLMPRPRTPFGHAAEVRLDVPPSPASAPAPASADGPAPASGPAGTAGPGGISGPLLMIGCYHPSQQNTFTGRLTGPMLDAVFERARDYSRST